MFCVVAVKPPGPVHANVNGAHPFITLISIAPVFPAPPQTFGVIKEISISTDTGYGTEIVAIELQFPFVIVA